jgi:hypothetical protein
MTRDDIIRMAREAGFENPMTTHSGSRICIPWEFFEHFAALVAAAKRRKHQADIERWKEAAMTAEKWRGLALSRDPGAAGATVQAIQQEATDAANASANASWRLMCERMVQAEREACANLCDEHMTDDNLESCNERTVTRHELAEHLAEQIRARGNHASS